MTDYLAAEPVRAITANRNRPFFIYLAFNAPRTPLQALRSDYDALPQIENHTERVSEQRASRAPVPTRSPRCPPSSPSTSGRWCRRAGRH